MKHVWELYVELDLIFIGKSDGLDKNINFYWRLPVKVWKDFITLKKWPSCLVDKLLASQVLVLAKPPKEVPRIDPFQRKSTQSSSRDVYTNFGTDYHTKTSHINKRFGMVHTWHEWQKKEETAQVGKTQDSPTKLTWTDLESNTPLCRDRWRLTTWATARPVLAITW
jgi:hypothetical protein